jgi:nucleoid DNA-binding protein
VTKKDIVRSISDSVSLAQTETKAIVQRTFDAIIETLVKDGRIELRNFGVFEVKERAPRKARNPRTGAEVRIPARRVVTFKPGKYMEDRIQGISSAAAAPAAEAVAAKPANPPASGPQQTT